MMRYSEHQTGDAERAALLDALDHHDLARGAPVNRFAAAVTERAGGKGAVLTSSGCAALWLAYHVLGNVNGRRFDSVSVPHLTFRGTWTASDDAARRIIWREPLETGLAPAPPAYADGERLDVAVDYAGQEAEEGDYDVVDACHSFGLPGQAKRGRFVVYSFHPAKVITTGEGGALVSEDEDLLERAHALAYDVRGREGLNLRMPTLSAALGLAQMKSLDERLRRRAELAAFYRAELGEWALPLAEGARHAWHLFVVRVGRDRDAVLERLHAAEIGAQVHYREGGPGLAEEILSLPLHAGLRDEEAERVVEEFRRAVHEAAPR